MQVDKSQKRPPVCMTRDQVAVAEGHLLVALKEAGGAAPAAAEEAVAPVAAAEVTADETVCDLVACGSVDVSSLWWRTRRRRARTSCGGT